MLCAAGVILMGVGAYVQVGARNYLNFLSETYLNTPIFIIIAGEDRPHHTLKGTVLATHLKGQC
jgi:hypothetical protein